MKSTRLKLSIIILTFIFIIAIVWIILTGVVFPRRYKETVENAAKIYMIDPNLVYAVIKQESNFYENAISKSGAKGLMQIMEPTAKETAREISSINREDYDIYDVYTNINIGTKYISNLLNYFDGNYYLALAAYNAGIGRISKWFEEPYTNYNDINDVINQIEYSETKNYLESVINNYKWYVMLYK